MDLIHLARHEDELDMWSDISFPLNLCDISVEHDSHHEFDNLFPMGRRKISLLSRVLHTPARSPEYDAIANSRNNRTMIMDEQVAKHAGFQMANIVANVNESHYQLHPVKTSRGWGWSN